MITNRKLGRLLIKTHAALNAEHLALMPHKFVAHACPPPSCDARVYIYICLRLNFALSTGPTLAPQCELEPLKVPPSLASRLSFHQPTGKGLQICVPGSLSKLISTRQIFLQVVARHSWSPCTDCRTDTESLYICTYLSCWKLLQPASTGAISVDSRDLSSS